MKRILSKFFNHAWIDHNEKLNNVLIGENMDDLFEDFDYIDYKLSSNLHVLTFCDYKDHYFV